MEMVDRYIYAVTKRLPQEQKDDIEKELRGLIEDMLSERCGEEEPEKTDIEKVLMELGEPSSLADKYRDTKRYLIGPEFFDIYIFVLKIVLGAVALGVLIASIAKFFVEPPSNVAQGISEMVSNVVPASFSSFTWVTIIFAVNERIRLNRNARVDTNHWRPSDLPEVPTDRSIIKRSEPIVGIIFSVIFIIGFNFADKLFGAYYFENGKLASVVPIFDPEGLKRFLPLITVLFSAAILKEILKLIIGRWTMLLGIINAALNTMSLVACAVIFANPDIWNASFVNEIFAKGMAQEGAVESVRNMWRIFTRSFIYIIAFGFIVDSIVSIYKGVKYKIPL